MEFAHLRVVEYGAPRETSEPRNDAKEQMGETSMTPTTASEPIMMPESMESEINTMESTAMLRVPPRSMALYYPTMSARGLRLRPFIQSASIRTIFAYKSSGSMAR